MSSSGEVDGVTYRGHRYEVHERPDGTGEIISNILDDPIEFEDEQKKRWALGYVRGYIDGWKDQGGP